MLSAMDCFSRCAPSLMFDGIENPILSEENVSTTGVTQENFKLPLPPKSLDSHQTQNNKSWTDPTASLHSREIHPLGR